MKKIKSLFSMTLLLCLVISFSAIASDTGEKHPSRLVDEADLITDDEEANLLEKLNEISERQEFDVAVVTVNGLDGKSAMEYADDYYDYNGYGFGDDKDGTLLLISMEDRDWYITTTGFGITAITDAGREYMAKKFTPALSDGNYYDAFDTYASLCDDYVTEAINGEPYDTGHLPKEKYTLFDFLFAMVIAFVVSAVIAFTAVMIMKSQLKTVRSQPAASSYVANGSMNIAAQNDRFLCSQVSRVKKPEKSSGSSTHTSSSGTSHGGGGGKF